MKKSFSLVEFLVVIAVVGILAIIIFPYYFSARKQLALQRATSQLALDIRKVQGMALSAEEIGGQVPQGGYGVYLETDFSTYILFADKNNNGKYTPGSGLGEMIKDIPFEQGEGVKIKDLKDSNGASQSYVNIIFIPAKPEVYLKDNSGNDLGPRISIEICLIDDESKTRTIKVNKAGLIFIE